MMILFWKINVYKTELTRWSSFVEITIRLVLRFSAAAICQRPPRIERLELRPCLVSIRTNWTRTRRSRRRIDHGNRRSLDELLGIFPRIDGRRDETRQRPIRTSKTTRDQVIDFDQIVGRLRFLLVSTFRHFQVETIYLHLMNLHEDFTGK